MTVYLLHFDRPICPWRPAQHYLGWTTDLESRVLAHRQGEGARLTEVALGRGIRFSVVRTWEGGREIERKLKRQKNGRRLCPICQEKLYHERVISRARRNGQSSSLR